ncbi:glycosyltransferase family 2 protein [uncultured Arcticibacterium sp.]|uniref:glycosyltransferase family 2 protein n=1 Tax=uncultured Arcticibacterium sp. TaxID=2173042 RepID=UPI0030F6802D
MKPIITASIVIYNNDRDALLKAIRSVLAAKELQTLYLVDNSDSDVFRNISKDKRVVYCHNKRNLGFGKAHNIAIRAALEGGSKFHFVVNPDIFFSKEVLRPMVNLMQNDEEIGLMMPRVLNNDGTVQFLPKLPPSPFYMIWRKIRIPKKAFNKFINLYEIRNAPPDQIYIAPRVSGCFSLLNLEVIKELGMYDERFFMYFEDSDLSRRIYQKYKTVYYPAVSVYHAYENGAGKSLKLFVLFVHSAIKYFNKWGWFFDKERKEINVRTMEQFDF